MKLDFNRLKLLAILLCVAVLSACSTTGAKLSAEPTADTNSAGSLTPAIITRDMISYDEDDDYNDWKSKNPNYIQLNGTSADINGTGAKADGGIVSITSAGVYALSGKLDNGQIIVDVENKGTVRLVLNGVEINSSNSSPIYVKNAGKTVISLPEGTKNTLSDGSNYTFADPAAEEPSAAIFSKDDLTVNGTGTLTIRANYRDGIVSKDDLIITGGNISVFAVDDGLIGRDMVLVKEGNISIEAGGDAIKTTNDTDAAKGFVAIEAGKFTLNSGADGIQAETSVLINGGNYTIVTGGGSANATVKVNDMRPGRMGRQPESASSTSGEDEKESKKAIKAASDISINGGTFNIDSSDDSIHSNNSINITVGEISIASGDDGIHADASITIEGGKIDIRKSYEGIESMVVTVSDGEIYILSSDDGINVNGGNDGSAVNGRPGQNEFAVSENSKLNINGGFISIDSSGDGLDSNGNIYMTGGNVFVSGPTSSGNGAIDYNGIFEISGGLLIAAGSSGMAQATSEQSEQSSIAMYYPTTQQAGASINLRDSKGNEVATFEPKKQYQSVVISSPDIVKGSTYTLYSGEAKIVDFTVSNSVTWLSEAGVTTQRGGNPGGGGRPGMKGDRFPDRREPQ